MPEFVNVDGVEVEVGAGSGAVDSVNGETGAVTLTAADIGSDPTGDVAATGLQAALAELAAEKATAVALAAEAVLARNAANLTSGTVADARIASTIARDSEVSAAVAVETAAREAIDDILADAIAAAEGNVLTQLAAEAALARDASNLTSGTVADARMTGAVVKSLYDANTVLAATSDNTPAALTMGASTILARLAAGNIVAATPAELRTLLDVPTTGEAILDTLVDANTLLGGTADNTPIAFPVAASRIVGRKATGDIDDMTTAELAALFGTPDGTKFLKDDGTLATPAGGGATNLATIYAFTG